MEHPFAQYIRELGRGKRGSRNLTLDEARQAFAMILTDNVTPEQLGAFLMLVRVKEETPEELAGFVLAARDTIHTPQPSPQVDLDWSSYAGKRRQLPWFLLSALLLAQNGVRVFMHGLRGRKDNRVYTPDALRQLGIAPCETLEHAAQQLAAVNFAFVELEHFQPKLAALIQLRDILGLRSPVHSLCRMLNPFGAPCLLQGIFHPPYKTIHQQAALLLAQPHTAVLKGDGGEIECNPDSPCEVATVHGDTMTLEQWPALFTQRHTKDSEMDARRLATVWSGESHDEYGEAAVTGTAAIALKLLGKATSIDQAQQLAKEYWQTRDHAFLPQLGSS